MTQTLDNPTENLKGMVERITFHNEENGFCVLRAKVRGHRELITVIGNAASITAGEYIDCRGNWINDKKHGLQFRSLELKTAPPFALDGIERYLGSGLVRGIGPHFAKQLVRQFGDKVFEVIEKTPHRLTELGGIGEKRRDMIVSAWQEQKSIREIMIFLQSHGVGTSRAVRIFKTYGEASIEKVRENPYRLALDIRGIGFKTADQLAGKLGIARNSLIRAQAGVRHVLQQLCEEGHCAVPYDQLVTSSSELLEISTSIIEEAINREITAKNLVSDAIEHEKCVYSSALYHAEACSAQALRKLNAAHPPWGEIDTIAALAWAEQKSQINLSRSQRDAIQTVLKHKVSIITGGPGVGKTTIMKVLLKIIVAKKISIALSAPTGRAAKRLSESTGLPAKTLHRLLEFDPTLYAFRYNSENQLPIDLLVIDECSMIDIMLLHHVMKAIPQHAAVIFVGDIDQLPSVGSGAVLSDMIQSGVISTVRLVEIFRQAQNSQIITNAHRVNQGIMPLRQQDKNSDFFTIYQNTPEEIHHALIEMVSARLPNYFHCDPKLDIQVLTPMNRGTLGSISLNIELQKRLNGEAEPKITKYGITFAPGDKVIQTVNNYDKEVFNGDIGFIHAIDLESSIVKIYFDERLVEYSLHELDELKLAYAISIHKSQGSEFPIVVMPIALQHFTLLARNLLYTGMTRGKKLVVLMGQKKAVGMAIHNNKVAHRVTNLSQRLQVSP